mgnify:CR=1 FL=1
MDAGVPIKAPVSGIAMGLIKEGDDVVILSDIQGIEDFLGDMDFKVCGTEKGITALQMDNKAKGLSTEILGRALKQAKAGRHFILQAMLAEIAAPREELRDTAPRIDTIHIASTRFARSLARAAKPFAASRIPRVLRLKSRKTAPCISRPSTRKPARLLALPSRLS